MMGSSEEGIKRGTDDSVMEVVLPELTERVKKTLILVKRGVEVGRGVMEGVGVLEGVRVKVGEGVLEGVKVGV